MKFEWNTNKEKINIKKHKISFEQASYVFSDKYALSKYDSKHSIDNEDRWVLLGRCKQDTILVVIHTFKNDKKTEAVRIISARKATKNEKKYYTERCFK